MEEELLDDGIRINYVNNIFSLTSFLSGMASLILLLYLYYKIDTLSLEEIESGSLSPLWKYLIVLLWLASVVCYFIAGARKEKEERLNAASAIWGVMLFMIFVAVVLYTIFAS